MSLIHRHVARATLLAAALLCSGSEASPQTPAGAQTSATGAKTLSPFQGSWGSFRVPAGGQPAAGEGLVIRECVGNTCKFRIVVTGPAVNGTGDGTVTIASATEAVLRMDDVIGGKVCSLRALRSAAPDRIQVEPGEGNCSAFVTAGTSFAHTYPLHSREAIVDPDTVGCFLASDPARLAVCTRKDVSDAQSAWEKQADQTDSILHNDPRDRGELRRIDAAKNAILQGCESATNVADCLLDGFTKSRIALSQQHPSAIAAMLAPGDAATGRAEARRIAGTYRHSFANGDVQGDHYRSTDTLKITLRADGGIDYDTHLEFYNGHECSLKGTARFAKNGMFVDSEKQDSDTAPLCVFQIAPGKDGVTFHDPDGACRQQNCGMRGMFEGSTFAFKDRIGGK